MTTEYIGVTTTSTVAEVIQKIKEVSQRLRSIQFVYVVAADERFIGVVSLRTLIISAKDRLMKEIMKTARDVPTVHTNKSLLSVATMMTKYNLASLAVLSHHGRLLGVITVDDIMRRLLPRA